MKKILEKILEGLAIAAGWLLAFMLVFGTLFTDTFHDKAVLSALAILCIYFFYRAEKLRKKLMKKEKAEK